MQGQKKSVEKNNNDTKVLVFTIVGILTLIMAISGATFAYFAATAFNNNTIKGNSGYVANPLTLAITESSQVASASLKLVPQIDSFVRNVATSTSQCIDANGNAVCQHYAITVTNTTTNSYYLDGHMSLTATNMPNLKWSVCSDEWVCTSTSYYTPSSTSLGNAFSIGAGASKTLYVVIWISETNTVQTDSNSFSGTVTFTGYNSADKSVTGVTSTIRS